MATKIPQDLIDYLTAMISPPGETASFWTSMDLGYYTLLDQLKDQVLCGLIVHGSPTPEQSKELLRILKPGAHLLIIAPDEQPTGHTATCNAEDAGFEIRDAICWINQAGDGERLHYVPKTARSEREAGCYDLPAKTGAEATDREEGTAGLDNPRAGAGRTANEVHNFHPTCKPMNLMIKLLGDVPDDQGPVIDPFLGSGTTGIACIHTGHDFIGIEREDEFIAISTTRINHWKGVVLRGDGFDECDIQSDYTPPAVKPEPKSKKPKSDIEDLFG